MNMAGQYKVPFSMEVGTGDTNVEFADNALLTPFCIRMRGEHFGLPELIFTAIWLENGCSTG